MQMINHFEKGSYLVQSPLIHKAPILAIIWVSLKQITRVISSPFFLLITVLISPLLQLK